MNTNLSDRSISAVSIIRVGSIFSVLAFLFFDLVPHVRAEAVEFLPGLVVAAIAFFAIGNFTLGLLRYKEINGAFALIFGQIISILYLYLRSAFSETSEVTLGVALPVTTVELWIIVSVILIVVTVRRRDSCIGGFSWFYFLLFILAIATQRELPREVMLSSDPDQHLFFATQIQRLGKVPIHQGIWGPEAFGYPSGFPSLVALWSWLSFNQPSHVLPIQPLLQTALAILAIGGFVGKRTSNGAMVYIGLFILFFIAYPYGFEPSYFFQEVTGRISALSFVAAALIASVADREDKLRALYMPASVVLAFINPALCVLPTVIFSLRYGFFEAKHFWLRALELIKNVALFCLLLLLEPYYLVKLSSSFSAHVYSQSSQQVVISVSDNLFGFKGIFRKFIDAFLINYFQSPIVALFLVAIMLLALFVYRNRINSSHIGLLGRLAVSIVIVWVIFTPIFSKLSLSQEFSLLNPYFQWAVQQGVLVTIFFSGALLSGALFGADRTPNVLIQSVVLLAVTVFGISFRDLYGKGDFRPRYDLCGGMGCINDDDRRSMQFLREQTFNFMKDHPNVTFAEIPKVLIPNAPARMALERRLLPTGASRILPNTEVFPSAFFFSQGSKDYTYHEYMKRVCKRLDLDWLNKRNINYLFLPSFRDGVCVRGLTKILKDDTRFLFRSGDSAVLSLAGSFDDQGDVRLHDIEEYPAVSDEQTLKK